MAPPDRRSFTVREKDNDVMVSFMGCPNCGKDVAKKRQLFFLSWFHLEKKCGKCKTPVRYNPWLIQAVFFCFVAGAVFQMAVEKLFSHNLEFWENVITLASLAAGLFIGKNLFVVDDRRVDR